MWTRRALAIRAEARAASGGCARLTLRPLRLALAILLYAAVAKPALAGFPDRLVRLVVTTAPGTSGDLIARLVAPHLSEQFGQTVIVENRPGANGNLAAAEVARSAADGHTILIIPSGTLVANLFLYPKSSSAALTGLTTLRRLVANDFMVAVNPELSPHDLPAFLGYLRGHPGEVTIGTSSQGSYPNLAAELLRKEAGVDVLIVKFNGEAAAATAAAGGHVKAVIAAPAALQSFIDGKTLVPLATTGAERNAAFPNLPTVRESGVPSYQIMGFVAAAVPSGTAEPTQAIIRRAIANALHMPEVGERLKEMQFSVVQEGEAVDDVIRAERKRLGDVIKSMGGALE